MTLFIKDLVSIGAVDAGDNPEAGIVFWKRKFRKGSPDIGGDGKQTANSGERLETSMVDEFDLSALPDETRDRVLAKIDQLQAERDAALAAVPEPVPVEKAVDPELAAEIVKAKAGADEARAELAVEKAARRDADMILKLRADGLEPLLGAADQVAPTLRVLKDSAPEAFDAIYANLTAAAQRVDLAKAFSELGASEGEEDADPIGKRDRWVSKLKKAGDTRTIKELRAEFWVQHPDAVAASREK